MVAALTGISRSSMLPRRGPARRPAAGVHPARRGDVFIAEEDIMSSPRPGRPHLPGDARTGDFLPLPRISYDEAMLKYGCDKPDLRFGLEIHDVTGLARGVEFKVFKSVAESGGCVRGLCAPACGSLSRKELDELTASSASTARRAGLVQGRGGQAQLAIAKFFNEASRDSSLRNSAPRAATSCCSSPTPWRLRRSRCAPCGSTCQRLNCRSPAISSCAGRGLPAVGVRQGPEAVAGLPPSVYVAASGGHRPPGERPRQREGPRLRHRAERHGDRGGSIRIHDPQTQQRVFRALSINEESARAKFGFLLDACVLARPRTAASRWGWTGLSCSFSAWTPSAT